MPSQVKPVFAVMILKIALSLCLFVFKDKEESVPLNLGIKALAYCVSSLCSFLVVSFCKLVIYF